nr:MAG TPA: vacuolar sorting protein [Caudoviricetes sp.]
MSSLSATFCDCKIYHNWYIMYHIITYILYKH